MKPLSSSAFIKEFFRFERPIPRVSLYSEEQVKNFDLKLVMEIVTRSTLRMFSQPNKDKMSFTCKTYGRECFEVTASKIGELYQITSNYSKMSHRYGCEFNEDDKCNEIYCLIKLKRGLIEEFIRAHDLMSASPSEILAKMSVDGEDFLVRQIKNQGSVRKIRKRLDNVINLDIKNSNRSKEEKPKVRKHKKKKAIKTKQIKRVKPSNNLSKDPINVTQSQSNIPQLRSQPKQSFQKERIRSLPMISFNDMAQNLFQSSSQSSSVVLEQIGQLQKVTSDVFLSLRNSVIKNSLETKSLNFIMFPQLNSEQQEHEKQN